MNAYRPCTATPVASGTGDAQGVEAADGLRLMGYSVRESAGSAAVADFNLRHGGANDDPLLVVGELAANGSDVRWFGPQGLACPDGVWVERVSGETELVLYTLATPGNL